MNINSKKKYEHLSQKGRAASLYASRFNWLVLPLHSIDINGKCTCNNAHCSGAAKHPRTQAGVKDCSKDLSVIANWWSKWPSANIGIATGAASGIFALDVDPRHCGDMSLSDLEDEYGDLPATVEAITGSKGRHILFDCPKNMRISNKVGIRPGLDIRGEGGYIVVAPSLHMSGKIYEWEHSSRPDEVAIAEAPEWLLNIFKTYDTKSISQTTNKWYELVREGVGEGHRNSTIASLAGHLLRHFIHPYVVLELLVAWNATKCRPPLIYDEILAVVESISKSEAYRRGIINE